MASLIGTLGSDQDRSTRKISADACSQLPASAYFPPKLAPAFHLHAVPARTASMKTLLIAFTLLASFHAQAATGSLFVQTAEQIRADGNFRCEELPQARKIYDQKQRCGNLIDEWKTYAMSLIEVPKRAKSRTSPLEEIVYRNTLITQSYAHLYMLSARSFPACGRALLPWVGGASLGSLKSGQVMRSGLSAVKGGIPYFDDVKDGDYRDRFWGLFGPLATTGLEQATLTLGDGNREIFRDLFWQLVAGATCGADSVVETLQKDPRTSTDAKLKRSLKSWLLLSEASRTCDSETVIRANKGFVEVEQYLVGQPVMYEGITKQVGGRMLSSIVEAAVPQALGEFPTFQAHAGKSRPDFLINFSDADQRVSWMQDQLGVMEVEFQSKWSDVTESLFCAVAKESEATRAFLEQ
jgi:hypothetical protein